MTPDQAIKILTQATESIPTTRTIHAQILQALEVLSKLIEHKDVSK